MTDFIWNGRKPKICTKLLEASHEQGGLRLAENSLRDKTLKIAWVGRWNKLTQNIRNLAYYHIKPQLQNSDFWCCNYAKQDVDQVCQARGFWRDVVMDWADFNYHNEVENIHELL